jgi:hypothetical protein
MPQPCSELVAARAADSDTFSHEDVQNVACGAGTGANHLVCIELALKIVQKINAGQRFMAYILLPLFPEGDP